MIAPMEWTQLGYDYLQKVDASLFHSGVDLNFGNGEDDRGKPINSIANGTVVFARATGGGWGNLVVIYHPAFGTWTRYGHLDSILVSAGEFVKEGQKIGTCGSTGGNWGPHLHFDVILKELPYWTQYVRGWSKEKIKEYYANPLEYIKENTSLDEPIVLWHKQNHIIEQWGNPPLELELKLGWTIYKSLKKIVNGELDKNSFIL